MKFLATACAITLCMLYSTITSAQKCYIPKPMTAQQIEKVKGVWTGHYVYEGKTYPITVTLYTNSDITCIIQGLPVNDVETAEQIRFCDGGEFHFKKILGELSYEFQGIPKENQIEGMLTVKNKDVIVGKNGRFLLKKAS